MTKGFGTNKLSNPKQILRRVLSKTSNSAKTGDRGAGAEDRASRMDARPPSRVNVEAELGLLKRQVEGLQQAVASMQSEGEKKEAAIAGLAREKERLAADLKRQQRANSTLKQQLEEEREFYYKEKELYCQEMNDCKKLKKNLKLGDYRAQIEHYKREIGKMKSTLTQTLEANYNLSVKFLRMKNTKYCIKNRLKKLETLHEHTVSEFSLQTENLKNELASIVDNQLQIPIPPSNKKYLQIVKQNSSLAHENLCLRLELDKLNLELERHRTLQIENETNGKLKYINHKTRSEPQMTKEPAAAAKSKSERKFRTGGAKELPEPLDLTPLEHADDGSDGKRKKKRRAGAQTPPPVAAPDEPAGGRDDGEADFRMLRLQLMEKPSQTYTQSSEVTTDGSYDAVRTQSAPEIVQTSAFFNDK